MKTLGDAVGNLEADLFVGREAELRLFSHWLCQEAPGILNIHGPGGAGKSALLRAFARAAGERPVVVLDGRGIRATPEDFWLALGATSSSSAAARLNDPPAVLLIDTYEDIVDLSRYLQSEFLPSLAQDVRVVIAGRHPLDMTWNSSRLLGRVMKSHQLGRLEPTAARDYLERRGITASEQQAELLEVSAGQPLALALAADLADKGVHGLANAPEWRLVVRSLVSELLREAHERGLRELLEAGSVVRQFDEDMLAVLTGRSDVTIAFEDLCRLSVVRPSVRGLMIHDDIRKAIREDLRWRRPEKYKELRRRALDYYRASLAQAEQAEARWLVAELLYLAESAAIQAIAFEEGTGEVAIEVGGPEDGPELLDFYPIASIGTYAAQGSTPADGASATAMLAAQLKFPALRIRLARNIAGKLAGFSIILPITNDAIGLFRPQGAVPQLVDAFQRRTGRELPVDAARSDLSLILHLSTEGSDAAGARGALVRDLVGSFSDEKTYLVTTPLPPIGALLTALGFEHIPEARNTLWGESFPMEGYVLDLAAIGYENWVNAIVAGTPPRPRPSVKEMEDALQSALQDWQDDGKLGRSSLARLLSEPGGSLGAAQVRERVVSALEGQEGDSDTQLALRAVELAYLQREMTHATAADRLHVSRATFYRLLKRGIRLLAGRLLGS